MAYVQLYCIWQITLTEIEMPSFDEIFAVNENNFFKKMTFDISISVGSC